MRSMLLAATITILPPTMSSAQAQDQFEELAEMIQEDLSEERREEELEQTESFPFNPALLLCLIPMVLMFSLGRHLGEKSS